MNYGLFGLVNGYVSQVGLNGLTLPGLVDWLTGVGVPEEMAKDALEVCKQAHATLAQLDLMGRVGDLYQDDSVKKG